MYLFDPDTLSNLLKKTPSALVLLNGFPNSLKELSNFRDVLVSFGSPCRQRPPSNPPTSGGKNKYSLPACGEGRGGVLRKTSQKLRKNYLRDAERAFLSHFFAGIFNQCASRNGTSAGDKETLQIAN